MPSGECNQQNRRYVKCPVGHISDPYAARFLTSSAFDAIFRRRRIKERVRSSCAGTHRDENRAVRLAILRTYERAYQKAQYQAARAVEVTMESDRDLSRCDVQTGS